MKQLVATILLKSDFVKSGHSYPLRAVVGYEYHLIDSFVYFVPVNVPVGLI